ncbi:MAG TPA: lactate utilization protein [Candidatus Methylomirabilis sp.]|nr:lactate utilization protein [Candidatus Methylomirabilis sp.]
MGTDALTFLTRLRAILARTGEATVWRGDATPAADWETRAQGIRAIAPGRWEELLPRFETELEAVAGRLHRATPAAVPGLVSRIAQERQLSRVVTWSEAALGVEGLLATLRAEGLQVEDGSENRDRDQYLGMDQGFRDALDRAEIGLTGVDHAVAESGSLIIMSGAGRARLVSCLPVVHVALLRAGQLLDTWEEVGVLLEALHRLDGFAKSQSSITFITGPSRSADIEFSLTRGVHGPREVHVIALDR